jgi:hypothetical protein
MCMSAPMKRLQILVTPDQQRRLTEAARSRGMAVTALVREAIDEKFPSQPSATERREAADFLLAMKVPAMTPEELDRLLADRFDVT